MDTSRQTQYDANDTSVSMYLSFDSSICSAAYKTLETTTAECSIVCPMEYEDITPENSQERNQDSTLEALDSHVEYIESVKVKDVHLPPSAVLPKRVLQNFNVVCSTPTKEQLLRSVEVVRGSSAERCINLRDAFMDIEDKDEKNKENALPQSEAKGSIAAVSKEQINAVIEKTMNNENIGSSSENNAGTKLDVIPAEATAENKDIIIYKQEFINTAQIVAHKTNQNKVHAPDPFNINKCDGGNEVSEGNVKSHKLNGIEKALESIPEDGDNTTLNNDCGDKSREAVVKTDINGFEKTVVSVTDNKDSILTNKKDTENTASEATESLKTKESQKTAANTIKSIDPVKTKRASIANKPNCEPDLLTNRPSRIATNKRFSINEIGMKATTIDKQITTDIPKLMNKVLKFAETNTVVVDKTKTAVVLDKQKPTTDTTKGRSSILPSTADKRPFTYTQRMSVLVKTTLNSPARKIARRSCAIVGPQSWKPAIAPTTNNGTAPAKASRKSMLPIGRTTMANDVTNPPIITKPTTITTANKITEPTKIKSVQSSRVSMYPNIDKPRTNNDSQNTTNVASALNVKKNLGGGIPGKMDSLFVCNVCGSKFSIKSLMDAHKRSHEGDGLPAFTKKPTATRSASNAPPTKATQQSNGINKCKYCDKKFALIRALHIHLLQNCPKIPPKEKRKLTFHEMDHVEKAQLPDIFHTNYGNLKTSSRDETSKATNGILPHRSASDLSSISVSSTDSISDKKALAEITMIANTAAAAADSLLPPEMAPPTTRAAKKSSTAHTGVHRTPNKSIICHTCKSSFKTIMDHIQHNMKVHFKNNEAQ